jgi:coenzyme F420 hydrogenase subunit delta
VFADLYNYDTVIFGCGNILMGDDGFGPGVIEHMEQHHVLPEGVTALDVGTSIRDILFDLLLSPFKPRRIFIVDAVSESGRQPGDLFELPLRLIPECKINDFSVHQFPSLNLLQELSEYLFETASIRNQGSWVHADEPAAATDKDMVRMAAASPIGKWCLR